MDNVANSDGPGVHNEGTMVIRGGSISGCRTGNGYNGGGIYNKGTLTISGCSITGNSCKGSGGGIYVDGTGSLSVSGNPVVSGNKKDEIDDNIKLSGGALIKVSGALTEGASLYVTPANATGVITSGYGAHNDASPSEYFHADNDAYGVAFSSGEARVDVVAVGYVYVERAWSDGKVVEWYNITNRDTIAFPQSGTLAGGWYFLNRDVTVNGRVSFTGDAHLVLRDGYTLDVKGLYIPKGSTLYIYGQSLDTGKIYSHPSGGAGIGGGDGSGTRGIYIAGGTVTAIGGEYAAGIGGGSGGGNIRTIHISGGNVTASSNSEAKSFCGGPGIGGGGIANMKGTIKITGAGTHVKATGGKGGAGIGAGGYLDLEGGGDMGGKIIIDCGEGSRIEATGGKYSAGIGAGIAGNMTGSVTIDGGNVYIKAGDDGGAGIGGGTEVWPNIGGEGGDVYINGGYVEISGVDSGAESIGHGDDDMKSGTVKLADGMRVTVGGDPIKRSDRTDECHSRNKGEKLVVEACPHEITYEIMESGHTAKCAWCYQKYSEEPHIFDDGSKCTVCEYQDGMITIHFEPGDEGVSGEMANVMVMPDSLYELPECGFTAPEGKRFGGWQLSDALYAEGDEITLNEHTTFTAVWLNLCTVHFEPSISEYEGEMTDVQVVEGDTYFLPECGYSSTWELLFREWVVIYDNQHSEHKNPGDPITVTNDIRVRGQWSLGVNLTFRPGYEGAPDEEKGYKVIIDKEITLPECEFTPPEGMAFAGWLIGEETLQPGDVISVPKSMIVIAQWQEITEEPAEEPTEETTEETTEEPAEETTEEPSEEPAEEPTEEPTEEPAEEPAEVPSEAPAEESAEEPAGEPAEQHVEAPAEEHAEEPAAERAEEAAEEPAKETAEEPAEEPAQEPAEESSEEPAEEPAEQPADAQMCTLTFSNGGADGEMEPVKVAQGSEYELPECEFSLDGLVFDSWEIEGADGTTNAQPGDVIVVETDETITATWLWNETDGIEYGEDEVENAEAGDEAEAADDAPAGLTIEAEETPAEGSDPDAPSEVGSVFNGAGIAAVIAAVVLVIITAGTVAAKKKKKE